MEPDAGSKLLQLIEQHYALLYRYAFRLSGSATDAEDLTQQTFLNAQTHLHDLRESERGKSWLCSILRNLYLKERRHRACVTVQSIEEMREPAGVTEDSEFDSERLQHALNELPEEYRSTLILFYFESFSYKDIADQMDVAVGTVMSRLSRGKAWLRQRLTRTTAVPEFAADPLGNRLQNVESVPAYPTPKPVPPSKPASNNSEVSNPLATERTRDNASLTDAPASVRQGATPVAASSWTA